jgi:hypothetical protein
LESLGWNKLSVRLERMSSDELATVLPLLGSRAARERLEILLFSQSHGSHGVITARERAAARNGMQTKSMSAEVAGRPMLALMRAIAGLLSRCDSAPCFPCSFSPCGLTSHRESVQLVVGAHL